MLIAVNIARAEPADPTHQHVSSSVGAYSDFVDEASHRFAIPASWIRAVMQVESLGDPHALSPKGAMGLMQIMPETWDVLRSRYGLGTDPYDPHDNVLAGAACLRELYDRYGAGGFLAAYNAAPARYEDHLATGRPLPDDTQDYDCRRAADRQRRAQHGNRCQCNRTRLDRGAVVRRAWR